MVLGRQCSKCRRRRRCRHSSQISRGANWAGQDGWQTARNAASSTTTKASQFFCSKHKKISWQEEGLEWRETAKEIGTETGMRIAVCVCAWQRHWHKSLDRKRCKPCCAHNNFYVAIKRRLLPRRFVCPFGFWLLPLLLALPLHSLARDEAIAN